MCENIEPYKLIKDITSLAAPIITIISALLGLFTETREEVTRIKNGIQETGKELTKWAWVSMIGILLGGAISLWSIINDDKLKKITDCIEESKNKELADRKRIQDSIYNSKMDSIMFLSSSLGLGIRETKLVSSNILTQSNKLIGSSQITLEKLDISYKKQTDLVDKQELLNQRNTKLLDQNQQLLHPLFPLQIRIIFTVELTDLEANWIKKYSDSLFHTKGKKLPSYFKEDFDGFYFSLHELPDTVSKYESAFESLHEFLERRILPEFIIKFYPDSINLQQYSAIRDKGFEIRGQSPYSLDEEIKSAKTYKVKYVVAPKNKGIRGEILINEPSRSSIWGNRISSLYQILNGYVVIENYYTPSRSKRAIESISFNCGYNYYDSYWISMKEKNKFKFSDVEVYFFRIKDLHPITTND